MPKKKNLQKIMKTPLRKENHFAKKMQTKKNLAKQENNTKQNKTKQNPLQTEKNFAIKHHKTHCKKIILQKTETKLLAKKIEITCKKTNFSKNKNKTTREKKK